MKPNDGYLDPNLNPQIVDYNNNDYTPRTGTMFGGEPSRNKQTGKNRRWFYFLLIFFFGFFGKDLWEIVCLFDCLLQWKCRFVLIFVTIWCDSMGWLRGELLITLIRPTQTVQFTFYFNAGLLLIEVWFRKTSHWNYVIWFMTANTNRRFDLTNEYCIICVIID